MGLFISFLLWFLMWPVSGFLLNRIFYMGGKSISDIPITQNAEVNLIVNMKVAKAAGIKIPKSFLRKASRTIE